MRRRPHLAYDVVEQVAAELGLRAVIERERHYVHPPFLRICFGETPIVSACLYMENGVPCENVIRLTQHDAYNPSVLVFDSATIDLADPSSIDLLIYYLRLAARRHEAIVFHASLCTAAMT